MKKVYLVIGKMKHKVSILTEKDCSNLIKAELSTLISNHLIIHSMGNRPFKINNKVSIKATLNSPKMTNSKASKQIITPIIQTIINPPTILRSISY